MAIVVGYFDTEDAATMAMDRLMNTPGFEKVETRVYSHGSSGNEGGTPIAGAFPTNVGGTVVGNNSMSPIPLTGWTESDWMGDLDSEERRYFSDAMSSGRGVLAMARVDREEDIGQVRRLFSQLGARTFADK